MSLYSIDVIVYLFCGLDASMPQSVPNVVHRVSILCIHHPIGNAVSERVRCHVASITTRSVTSVGFDLGLGSDLVQHVTHALRGDPLARP